MPPFSYLFSKADKCFPLQYPWGRVGNLGSLYRQHEFSKQQLVSVSTGLSWLTTANHSRIAVEGCTDVRLQFLIASLDHWLYFWCQCESVWVYTCVFRGRVWDYSVALPRECNSDSTALSAAALDLVSWIFNDCSPVHLMCLQQQPGMSSIQYGLQCSFKQKLLL